MALSDQIAAYEDCLDLYERAMSDGKGARVMLENENQARLFQLRMNHARVLLRQDSKQIYDKIDPRYGKSQYDKFANKLRQDVEGNWWVYVEQTIQNLLAIEGLTEIEST